MMYLVGAIDLYIRNKKKMKEDTNKNNLELDHYDKGILVSPNLFIFLFSYFVIPFIEKININIEKKESTNYSSIPPNVAKSNDWFVVDKSILQSSIQTNGTSLNLNQKISEIDSSQLEFESVIGKGSFGQVWKGKWRQTQMQHSYFQINFFFGRKRKEKDNFLFVFTN